MRVSPRFQLGSCVATLGAVRILPDESGDWRFNAAVYLLRHQGGDWGDVPPEDARENELSVREGFRVLLIPSQTSKPQNLAA